MRLLTTHTVHHPSEDKYLQLYQGDLARIPSGQEVDLLIVSAFANDYVPTETSLIGALYREGVSVEELSRDKEEDLRANFSSWLSKDLSHSFPTAGFRRILCFESVGNRSAPETVGNIFRAIMPFVLGEHPIRTIAMPLLAAGDQAYDAGDMLRALFDAAAHWLANGLPVQTIKLVIHREAHVEKLTKLFIQLSNAFPKSEKQMPSAGISDYKYDFFLSYAKHDSEVMGVLADGAKTANPLLRMYRYEGQINPGQSWQKEIDSALQACRRVVTLISPSYLESEVCQEEFAMARVLNRRSVDGVFCPIYLCNVSLPLFMETLQYIDCREADRGLLVKAASKLAIL